MFAICQKANSLDDVKRVNENIFYETIFIGCINLQSVMLSPILSFFLSEEEVHGVYTSTEKKYIYHLSK